MTDYFTLNHIIYSVFLHVHQRTTTVSYSKSSSDYCCCQETLSLFFSDRYCRGEDGGRGRKKNQHCNCANIVTHRLMRQRSVHYNYFAIMGWLRLVYCESQSTQFSTQRSWRLSHSFTLLKCVIDLLNNGQSELMSSKCFYPEASFASAVPSSCCWWPVAARPAPWSECFCGGAVPRWYEARPEPSRTACGLKGWQVRIRISVIGQVQFFLWFHYLG